jgi:acetyl esterase
LSNRFAAAYAKAGGDITLRKFEGEPHGFISNAPTSQASREALALINDFISSHTR